MKRPQRPKSSPQPQRPTRSVVDGLKAASLILLVAFVYAPSLSSGFVWDDDIHVEKNPTLVSATGLRDIWLELGAIPQYYPLVHTTFWAEYRLWGLAPVGYHAVNLLLHAVNVLLVWRVLLRLAVPGAWLGAAIFAVHPVEVESVAWITERKNVLSCALALGSILAYLRFSQPMPVADPRVEPASNGWRYYALSLALFVAALLSKTVTASVPAVLLVIFWWKRDRVTRRDVELLAPFFAVGLALSAITVWIELRHVGASGDEWSLTAVERVLVAGRALWFYAGKLAWPHPLVFFYPRWSIDPNIWWQYLFPAAAIVLIAGLWRARARIGRGPLAAVLIFAGVLAPALGFFNVYPFRYSFVADHFQYHASIALLALAAAALSWAADRLSRQTPWIVPLAVVALLTSLALLAREQTATYKNLGALYTSILASNPQSWIAHQNLGRFLHSQEDYPQAISHFQSAIEIHQRLLDENPAAAHHRAALAECYVNLAFGLHRTGQLAEAIAWHRKAIALRKPLARENPGDDAFEQDIAASYLDIGVLQSMLGQTEEASSSFAQASDIRERLAREHPGIAAYQASLARIYIGQALSQQISGRPAEAEASQLKAIAIRKQLAHDHLEDSQHTEKLAGDYATLGAIQLSGGRPREAQASLQAAVSIGEQLVRNDPDNEALKAELAIAQRALAKIDAAIRAKP